MANYIDALNGDHTDGSEQFPQLDENKRVELEELVAERLLEYADTQELERVYFDLQHEWAMSLPDAELLETAERLNIEI